MHKTIFSIKNRLENSFGIWRFHQYIQYFLGDIGLVLSRKNIWTYKDFLFWRKKTYHSKDQIPTTYYVIRRRSGHKKLEGSQNMGICGWMMFTLGDIAYALNNNFVPVIDMMTYSNSYLMPDDVNKYNAWEFFFKPVIPYNLKKLRANGNVIISTGILESEMPSYDVLMDSDWEHLNLNKWRNLTTLYMEPQESIQQNAKKFLDQYHFSEHKTLGVLCRGTDFVTEKPHGHPIQPDIATVIHDVENAMFKYGFTQIYLATEDFDIYYQFKSHFKNKVITYSAPNVKYERGPYLKNVYHTTEYLKQNGLNYLTSIWIMSKCNGIVGGITSGTLAALLFGNNFEYVFYYREGYYD